MTDFDPLNVGDGAAGIFSVAEDYLMHPRPAGRGCQDGGLQELSSFH